MGEKHPWWVYLVRCADGTFYTGTARDLDLRVSAHNRGTSGAKYVLPRRPVVLAWAERVPDLSTALRREHRVRRLSRAGKEALAASFRPSLRR